MKKPEIITATPEQIEGVLDRIQPIILETDYKLIAGIILLYLQILFQLERSKLTIIKLKHLMFGPATEKRNTLQESTDTAVAQSELGDKKSSKSDADSAVSCNESSKLKAVADSNKPKKKGHGHNPISAYPGAEHISCQHTTLKEGDICPVCKKGRLSFWNPRTVKRFIIQPFVRLYLCTLEVLRCSNRSECGKLFPAGWPDGIAEQPKYSKGFGAYFANMYYGFGMPMYRMEMLLKLHGTPIPDSVQWKLIEEASPPVIAVYRALEQCAANGQIANIDDTTMKVLSLMEARKEAEIAEKPTRKGIYTSTIAVQVDGHTIVLYYTGHDHAGNNLDKVLKHRDPTLEPLIQMSDGLAANTSGNKGTISCWCMVHARRNFFLIREQFPTECKYVLDAIGQLYQYEQDCEDRQLTQLQRMLYHRMFSGPVLQELKSWLDEQIEQKKTEPNSSLGEAIRYMRKHWEELTQFLRHIGAPLDNNLAERLMKQPILRRKNSYYYKTANGALVGDAYMSSISTCKREGVNQYQYLLQLELNAVAVLANPKLWLPSNAYKQLTGRESELIKPQIDLKATEKIDTPVWGLYPLALMPGDLYTLTSWIKKVDVPQSELENAYKFNTEPTGVFTLKSGLENTYVPVLKTDLINVFRLDLEAEHTFKSWSKVPYILRPEVEITYTSRTKKTDILKTTLDVGYTCKLWLKETYTVRPGLEIACTFKPGPEGAYTLASALKRCNIPWFVPENRYVLKFALFSPRLDLAYAIDSNLDDVYTITLESKDKLKLRLDGSYTQVIIPEQKRARSSSKQDEACPSPKTKGTRPTPKGQSP
jgi:hypothetical protein